jgi:hypothetical protein
MGHKWAGQKEVGIQWSVRLVPKVGGRARRGGSHVNSKRLSEKKKIRLEMLSFEQLRSGTPKSGK